MVRAAHYLAGAEMPMWLPLVADDLLALSGGAQIRSSLISGGWLAGYRFAWCISAVKERRAAEHT